jgi:hypothetical protein
MEAEETFAFFSQMLIKLWKIKELLTLGACTDKHGNMEKIDWKKHENISY